MKLFHIIEFYLLASLKLIDKKKLKYKIFLALYFLTSRYSFLYFCALLPYFLLSSVQFLISYI